MEADVVWWTPPSGGVEKVSLQIEVLLQDFDNWDSEGLGKSVDWGLWVISLDLRMGEIAGEENWSREEWDDGENEESGEKVWEGSEGGEERVETVGGQVKEGVGPVTGVGETAGPTRGSQLGPLELVIAVLVLDVLRMRWSWALMVEDLCKSGGRESAESELMLDSWDMASWSGRNVSCSLTSLVMKSMEVILALCCALVV